MSCRSAGSWVVERSAVGPLLLHCWRTQDGGFSRKCSASGRVLYPRVDPAIITLVTAGADWCLLGRKPDWVAGRCGSLHVVSHAAAHATCTHACNCLPAAMLVQAQCLHECMCCCPARAAHTNYTQCASHACIGARGRSGIPRWRGFLRLGRRWSRRWCARWQRSLAWPWTLALCGAKIAIARR